jgi:hypothetical protein
VVCAVLQLEVGEDGSVVGGRLAAPGGGVGGDAGQLIQAGLPDYLDLG